MLVNQQTRQVQIQSKMKIQTHPLQSSPNSNRIEENHRLLIRGQIQIQIQMNTQTHTWQGSQQTGTARLVGWRINPVAGGTIASYCPAQVYFYLYLLLCYICIRYCVCICILPRTITFCHKWCKKLFFLLAYPHHHFLTYCIKDL